MRKPPATAIYLASTLLVSVVINVILLCAIFMATGRLQAQPWQLGLLGAAVTGIYALMCPIFGRLIGRADPRPKAMAVCLMYVVVGSVAPGVRSVWPLVALVGLLGVAGAIYWPMIEGVICEGRTRAQMRRNLGTFSILWCAGVALGTLAAGPLYDLGGHWAFLLAAGIALALLLLFAVSPSPHGPQRIPDGTSAANEEEVIPRETANGFLYLSKVLVFLAYFTYGALRTLFPKYGAQIGFSATVVSRLLFVTVAAQTGVFLLFRTTGFWHYRFWPMFAGAGGAAISFFALGWVSSPAGLVMPFFVIGLFLGCSYFSSIYYSMARPRAGVESAAWHEMTLGTGSTLGPILAGLFAEQTGSLTSPFLLSGAAAAIGLGIAIQFYLRQVGRSEPQDGP